MEDYSASMGEFRQLHFSEKELRLGGERDSALVGKFCQLRQFRLGGRKLRLVGELRLGGNRGMRREEGHMIGRTPRGLNRHRPLDPAFDIRWGETDTVLEIWLGVFEVQLWSPFWSISGKIICRECNASYG